MHLLCDDSMGVGRSGVFIALSIALERMRYEGVVDMFQTVRMLRTQRPAMVQTEVCITITSGNELNSYFILTQVAAFHSLWLLASNPQQVC